MHSFLKEIKFCYIYIYIYQLMLKIGRQEMRQKADMLYYVQYMWKIGLSNLIVLLPVSQYLPVKPKGHVHAPVTWSHVAPF